MKTIEKKAIAMQVNPLRFPVLAGLLCALFLFQSGGPVRAQGMDEDAQRLAELVEQIKEGMKAVDDKLLEAGSDRAARAGEGEVGRILDETRRMHARIIRDIEELIRSIKYAPPTSSSSSGEQRPQEKNQPRSEEPRDGDLQKNPMKPEDMEGAPKDGGASQDPPKQEQARTPPPGTDPEDARHRDTSGRWGLLPPKVQEEILNSNVDDFPAKYRKWLEEYYRRAAERE
jgi:hypothetical protein